MKITKVSRPCLVALAVGLVAIGGVSMAGVYPLPKGAIQVPSGAGEWNKGPPSVPGSQVMRLEGDSTRAEMFTLRLKVPAGAKIRPHWHPSDERVTVLSGEARVGFGDTFDEGATSRLGPGSFYINPAQSHHYLIFPVETVLQVTGMGPWELHFLDEADD
jgi:quercetin dioxygenase-like cupin family protein